MKLTIKKPRQLKRGDVVLSFGFLGTPVEARQHLTAAQAFIDGGARVSPIGRVRKAQVLYDDDIIAVEFWPEEGDDREKPVNYSLIGHFIVIDKEKAK